MSDLDLFISNGTCYYATNRKAADTFIPCGNAANAAYTCCLKGDVLPRGLRDSGGTTYIAGCTDPGFGSVAGACLHKGKFADQHIVGLVRCQDSDDKSKPDELWAGCPGDKAKTEMTGVPSPCSCSDPDYQGLFRQRPTIEAVATLPKVLGQTVLFAKGHEPKSSFQAETSSPEAGSSATPSSTTVVKSAPTTFRSDSALVTTAPSASSSADFATGVPVSAKEQSTPDQGLSAGANAGIAVGVVLAVLLSSAIFFLAVTLRRRHQRTSGKGGAETEAEVENAGKAPLTTTEDLAATPPTEQHPHIPPSGHNSPDLATAAPGAGSGRLAEEWFKPELAADESTTISSSSPDPAAVLASVINKSSVRKSRDSRSAD
ncbi:hypothetical protein PG996_010420 [Apiospora saccharicola]|uniref:Uncharacterized protein n=1 Tax=Apiospora saccharicola TaxID=335842 RepID=A0ABR1UNI6_9PEZI